MNVLKIALIGCVVLIINNLVLLNTMGYFSNQNQAKKDEIPSQQAKATERLRVEQRQSQTATQKTIPEGDFAKQASISSIDETRMIDLLRNVAETEDFIVILDNYQAKASRRYMQMQKKFGSMKAVELYDVIQNSESDRDRQFALQVLTQSNFGELETYQLKEILNSQDLQNWHKGKLISNLLERRDPEALGFAKNYMSENTSSRYIDQDLIRNIYDLDPQYIKEFVGDLDLTRGRESFTVLSVALEDPKISKEFYAKNFDQIVDSKNSELFNYLRSPSSLELSASQQGKIVDLLKSPNRQKRQFAMGMLHNIENLDTIRVAFQGIERESEKRNFIYSMVGRADNPERKQLAKELAKSIDDPQLQKFLK